MLDWIRGWFWMILDTLQAYNGAITAVATIFIGAFTYVLAIVTRKQARLTRESIDLARREFDATHRPRIGVRFFETFSEPTITLRFTVVNQGETKAKILTIGARIIQDVAAPTHVVFDDEAIGVELESGQADTHRVASQFPNPHHNNWRGYNLGAPPTFCVGRIRYTDSSGIERETGFCRVWAFQTDIWYTPEFETEYEYSY